VVDFWMAFSNVVIIVGRLVSAKPANAIAGTADPYADHDLLAQALMHQVPRSDILRTSP
jgi:hypothetical protein